jgi:hypothetical protein
MLCESMLTPEDKQSAPGSTLPRARFYTVSVVDEDGESTQLGEELTSRDEAVLIATWRGGIAWAHGCFDGARSWVRWRVWS